MCILTKGSHFPLAAASFSHMLILSENWRHCFSPHRNVTTIFPKAIRMQALSSSVLVIKVFIREQRMCQGPQALLVLILSLRKPYLVSLLSEVVCVCVYFCLPGLVFRLQPSPWEVKQLSHFSYPYTFGGSRSYDTWYSIKYHIEVGEGVFGTGNNLCAN